MLKYRGKKQRTKKNMMNENDNGRKNQKKKKKEFARNDNICLKLKK